MENNIWYTIKFSIKPWFKKVYVGENEKLQFDDCINLVEKICNTYGYFCKLELDIKHFIFKNERIVFYRITDKFKLKVGYIKIFRHYDKWVTNCTREVFNSMYQ